MMNRMQSWEPQREQPGLSGLGAARSTPSRWTAWAERLGGRFTRQAMRRFGPQQILAQTPASRWLQASLSFSPHINLTFQRGLEASLPAEQTQPAPARWERQESLGRPWNPPAYPLQGRDPSEPASTQTPGGATAMTWPAPLRTAETPGLAAQSGGVAMQRQSGSQTGMTPLMQRGDERRAFSSSPDKSWKRVEQTVVQPPAILKSEPYGEPGPRISPARARTPAGMEGEQVYELPGRLRNPAPISLPEGELERLTEQVVRKIDERIVAHRERLGRVF